MNLNMNFSGRNRKPWDARGIERLGKPMVMIDAGETR